LEARPALVNRPEASMLGGVMLFLDRLERRLGWLSFPGFLRYYALFHLLVYGLALLRPEVRELFDFDRGKILSGEVWRVVTFLFTGFGGGGGLFEMIFLVFMVLIANLMSDALEGTWGVFRTSMYHYTGIFGLVIANFIYPQTVMPGSGFLLYQAAFFAFATLFPKVEFRLFLILPVQVKYLAIFLAVLLVGLPVLEHPLRVPFFLLAFGNYVLWAAIPALKGRARLVQSAKRRGKFKAATAPEAGAFHTCVVCGRTEVSDPRLEFRVGADGEEYCVDHLPK
jgi:hypothetical protein